MGELIMMHLTPHSFSHLQPSFQFLSCVNQPRLVRCSLSKRRCCSCCCCSSTKAALRLFKDKLIVAGRSTTTQQHRFRDAWRDSRKKKKIIVCGLGQSFSGAAAEEDDFSSSRSSSWGQTAGRRRRSSKLVLMCESERASAFGSDGSGSEAAKNSNAGGSGESSESFGEIEGVDDRGEQPSGDHAWYPRVSRKSFVLGTTHRMIFVEEKTSAGVGKKTWHLCI